jgi:hypothetical protein
MERPPEPPSDQPTRRAIENLLEVLSQVFPEPLRSIRNLRLLKKLKGRGALAIVVAAIASFFVQLVQPGPTTHDKPQTQQATAAANKSKEVVSARVSAEGNKARNSPGANTLGARSPTCVVTLNFGNGGQEVLTNAPAGTVTGPGASAIAKTHSVGGTGTSVADNLPLSPATKGPSVGQAVKPAPGSREPNGKDPNSKPSTPGTPTGGTPAH